MTFIPGLAFYPDSRGYDRVVVIYAEFDDVRDSLYNLLNSKIKSRGFDPSNKDITLEMGLRWCGVPITDETWVNVIVNDIVLGHDRKHGYYIKFIIEED